MSNIKNLITAVTQQIQVAAKQANRNEADIQLLAVSKTKPVSAIIEAYDAGQRRFGENYIQEAEQKILSIKANPLINNIEWHFIGPIQSNKTKILAQHFDWVQSIDRLKVARRLNEQRPNELLPLNVCIQVNISGELQKAGVTLSEVFELASQIMTMKGLKLRGLMAIPENSIDNNLLIERFTQLQNLYLRLQKEYPQVDTLSMGMSQDMQLAISCGSTMVRVGTAIFGQREIKQNEK